MAKKKTIMDYKKSVEKKERDLDKVQSGLKSLQDREKQLIQDLAQAKAEYITQLLQQSGSSLSDLEALLAPIPTDSEPGYGEG
ncbi:TPA: hypothetical protein U0908_000679 [Streptococcus suis 14A]|uniref:hypothetical protein n=1 Tax=Streptococcus suis TaxID=1307 RepID=UPI0004125C74|nr:hypothetical protein [Streptococcus suis]HEM3198517.1 hypothetical protein [Streptococcus suis 14A]